MNALKKIRLYASAARHMSPLALAGRVARGLRTRRVTSQFDRMLNGLDGAPAARFAKILATPDFVAGSRRLAELTAGVYAFDAAARTLTFRLSGDVMDLDQVRNIPWTTPDKIAASDVNRAFFVAFMEQATLAVLAHPQAGLDHLANVVTQLDETAKPTPRYLTMPWQPLPAARRLTNLLAALSLALDADPAVAVTPAFATLIANVRQSARIADYLREDDLGYNHLATAIFGQCLFAAADDDQPLLAKRGKQFLDCLEGQVGADGLQLERSATYQAHLLGHLDVLNAGAIFPPALRDRAAKLAQRMRAALVLMTHPDGQFAIFNDCAAGDGPSPASLHAFPAPLASGLHRLDTAGFLRLDAGDTVGFFDVGLCGPDDAPGHAHADFLALELSLKGQRFFVDPGVASYKGGAERDWTRSSHTHNGPTFDGAEPIEFFGAFRVGRRGRAFELAADLLGAPIEAAGTQNGFDRIGGRVARLVALWPGQGLAVIDRWKGADTLQAASTFLIDAAWTLKAETAASLTFETAAGGKATLTVLDGTLSHAVGRHFAYGPRKPMPATQVRITPIAGAGPRRVVLSLTLDEATLPLTLAQIDQAADTLLARALQR
jgi:hypothetical protein